MNSISHFSSIKDRSSHELSNFYTTFYSNQDIWGYPLSYQHSQENLQVKSSTSIVNVQTTTNSFHSVIRCYL